MILEKIPNPAAADLVLQVANFECLKRQTYSADNALAVLDAVDSLLDRGTTYADLVSYVLSRFADFNHDLGAEVLIASSYLHVLDEPLPISDCDRVLLRAHIRHQRGILEMVK